MKWVPARISEAQAQARFEARGLGRFLPWNRMSAAAARGGERRVPRLELLWLPQYLVTIHVTSRRGPGEAFVMVDGHAGAFALLDEERPFNEGQPPGEAFPPAMSADDAASIGRKELLRSIMKRRGQRNRPTIQEVAGVEMFHYPYWVYYYERSRGRLDIRILDAVSGEPGRARTKVAVLSALAMGSQE